MPDQLPIPPGFGRGKKTTFGTIVVAIIAVIVAILQQKTSRRSAGEIRTAPSGASASQTRNSSLADAMKAKSSGVQVQGRGVVFRLLADDTDGDRHQRFLVKLSTGEVIKVSHNLDLAPRVPAREKDDIEFSGEFEWNEGLGGAVHWTHHDPRGKHQDGWIQLDGKRYQ